MKYHSVLLHVSLKDDNDTQSQVASLHCVANKLRGTFAQCSAAVKSTVWCKLHANTYLHLRCRNAKSGTDTPFAYNPYWIFQNIQRNTRVHAHQVSYFVRTSDSLIRNNLYAFVVTRCASSLHETYLSAHFNCLTLFTNVHSYPIM